MGGWGGVNCELLLIHGGGGGVCVCVSTESRWFSPLGLDVSCSISLVGEGVEPPQPAGLFRFCSMSASQAACSNWVDGAVSHVLCKI